MDITHIKNAINHIQPKKLPYMPQITRQVNEKYGEMLLKDYYNRDVMSAYEKNLISRCDAIYLSIGNHAIGIDPPWWSWYDTKDYATSQIAPDYIPKVKGTGSYTAYTCYTEFLKQNFGCYITAFIWGSHFEKAYFARGIENFLADMACEPEFAQSLLNHIIDKNMVMIENLLSNENIDGVLLGSDWGAQKSLLMSPEQWKSMIKPGEQKEYDLIHSYGKHVWLHSCGNIRQIMDDIYCMGVDVLNPLQPECMDIYEIKDKFGDKITFWGGISTQRTLPFGTVDEVRKQTEKVILSMSSHGGYIAAPAQEIQSDVPYENIKALIDVFRHYGT